MGEPERLTPEQRADLHSRFRAWWWPHEADEIIEEALNHSAARKCKSQYLYLRNWLRRDSERRRPVAPQAIARNRPGTNYGTW